MVSTHLFLGPCRGCFILGNLLLSNNFVDERRSSVLNDQATVIFDVEFDVQLFLPWQISLQVDGISYLV